MGQPIGLFVALHKRDISSSIDSRINRHNLLFHLDGLLNVIFQWHFVLYHRAVPDTLISFLDDVFDHGLNVLFDEGLALILSIHEPLVEHQLLPPFQSFVVPRLVFIEHLEEDDEGDYDVSEDNGTPPMRSFGCQHQVGVDQCEVDYEGDAEDDLRLKLELELRVEVQLPDEVGSEEVFDEHLDCTYRNIDFICTLSEKKDAEAEQELVEPGRPPVDVLAGVVQEVCGLPRIR